MKQKIEEMLSFQRQERLLSMKEHDKTEHKADFSEYTGIEGEK